MIYLRECKEEDCDLLFEWANDRSVRENAFNVEPIEHNTHCNWFVNSLKSDKRKIFIALNDTNDSVGMIRVDIDGNEAVISYLIDKNHRGNGLGTYMIKAIENIVRDKFENVEKLIALVKHENYPSRRIFEKCGYEKNEEIEFVKYTLDIK